MWVKQAGDKVFIQDTRSIELKQVGNFKYGIWNLF